MVQEQELEIIENISISLTVGDIKNICKHGETVKNIQKKFADTMVEKLLLKNEKKKFTKLEKGKINPFKTVFSKNTQSKKEEFVYSNPRTHSLTNFALGPNISLTIKGIGKNGGINRLNLFSPVKNKDCLKSVGKLAKSVIEFRNKNYKSLFNIYVNGMKKNENIGGKKNPKIEEPIWTHFITVRNVFNEINIKIQATKTFKEFQELGLGINSFCQSWDKDTGNANFSIMSPHFQTRFYISNTDKFLLSFPKKEAFLEAYNNILVHFLELLNSNLYFEKYINIDKLVKVINYNCPKVLGLDLDDCLLKEYPWEEYSKRFPDAKDETKARSEHPLMREMTYIVEELKDDLKKEVEDVRKVKYKTKKYLKNPPSHGKNQILNAEWNGYKQLQMKFLLFLRPNTEDLIKIAIDAYIDGKIGGIYIISANDSSRTIAFFNQIKIYNEKTMSELNGLYPGLFIVVPRYQFMVPDKKRETKKSIDQLIELYNKEHQDFDKINPNTNFIVMDDKPRDVVTRTRDTIIGVKPFTQQSITDILTHQNPFEDMKFLDSLKDAIESYGLEKYVGNDPNRYLDLAGGRKINRRKTRKRKRKKTRKKKKKNKRKKSRKRKKHKYYY